MASLPMRERELKLGAQGHATFCRGSLPTRERELKPSSPPLSLPLSSSLPMRERELKPAYRRRGVWIQIASHSAANG